MPAFQVEKSMEINAPLDVTRQSIENFHAWPNWSPWLCSKSHAKIEFRFEELDSNKTRVSWAMDSKLPFG